MDRGIMEYNLRQKNGGINGLSIKHRRIQDRTAKPIMADVHKTEGDLRNYTTSGVIGPTEDYWISGEGRTPIAIREVQTTVESMKKYALLEARRQPDQKQPKFRSKKQKEKEEQKPVTYDVRYVYSEGIDFRKMTEDEDYAKAVIGLLQEDRLQKKQNDSYELGSDTVYLGTIANINGKYVKAGIKEYAAAIIKIDSHMQQQHQAVMEKHRSVLETQRTREKNEERKDVTRKLSRDEWKEYLKDLISACDISEAATILREAWEEILEEKQTETKQNPDNQDFLEW